MTQDTIIDLIRSCLLTIILISAPPLLIGLVVGVLVSMFQTITSINEPTLAFIPKILGILLSLLIFGSFMMTTMNEFIINLYSRIPELLIPK